MFFLSGFAMHYYSNSKSYATQFTPEAMREQLSSFAEIEKAVVQQHALLRSFDPEGRVDLLLDEWGVWDRIAEEDVKRYGALWQQITMRSAVAAALGLNLFHRQADKLAMTNIAQTVNVLHSLLLTEKEKCVRTSTYYAFELAKPHRGKASVRFESDDKDPLGLSVSASRSEGEVVLTLVNPGQDRAMTVDCALAGAAAGSATGRILQHADLNACNTFEAPNTIVPREHRVEMARGGMRIELPPLGIVTATARLV